MTEIEQKIQHNRTYAALLGWSPIDWGALEFDELLIAMIGAQQAVFGFTLDDQDGIAGPKSYRALLVQRQANWLAQMPHVTGDEKLVLAGRVALCELKRLWLTRIADLPPRSSSDYERCRSVIDEMIRTRIGIAWSWEDPYDQHFEWCGTGPARGWGAAGLDLDLRRNLFASTYRLYQYARYKPMSSTVKNEPPPIGQSRRMILSLDEHSKPGDVLMPDGSKPRAGDIVLMGGVNTGPGKHIETTETFDPKTGLFTTIGCNATGYWPDGSRVHGVARAVRRVGLGTGLPPTTYFVRHVIRPAVEDLAGHE